ncbi:MULTISPECIES: STAS domain-containing protein [Stenotrophomonas]|jgi:rsbT co-antagonist protein RsbR|uniref:STAS domain-containing protein n=1 Tax=Stenotrophomonas bentonitica TaxID=1450134 RepID=A0ABU9JQ86_9GAMM|nr:MULTISPECIES: STAS domain-containing protein [unclassified Stenotrophomonas]AOX61029.1 polyvinylalcohol dehydrogenase [Stenotrophomonas sp. LM091]MDX5515814.1 STAS domain-containing protein [Stenotrophomonas sp. RG-453]OFS89842.1 polyvinylalcohol dehydrogenase [Stenotrophomonas sp. HMSC10F06]
MAALQQRTIDLIRSHQEPLLAAWAGNLAGSSQAQDGRLSSRELDQQVREFWRLFLEALSATEVSSIARVEWQDIRRFLEELSRERVLKGFNSSETASFIFSLKRPLFEVIQQGYANDPAQLGDQLWAVSELIDQLGLHTVSVFQKTREDVIQRQQEEMLELSTPVVKLWEGVLALPMIGTLDSQRTQVVMESLLQRIVDTGSEIAIIDITGVPTVDTLVAQHLLKTVTAIRLMGADAIISGVRPQIAQTIVHLGLDLQGIVTKANLADALALALKRTGQTVTRTAR